MPLRFACKSPITRRTAKIWNSGVGYDLAALEFRRAADVLLWERVRRHWCGGGECEWGWERQQAVARGVQQGETEDEQ
jgi:hypothetical protein